MPFADPLREIEARGLRSVRADDFILSTPTLLYGAIFTGLTPPDITFDDIGTITVEIYRVFANDSDTTRTPNAPTRTNSPGDVEFAHRSTEDGNLAFTFVTLQLQYSDRFSVFGASFPPIRRKFNAGGASVRRTEHRKVESSAL